MDSLLFTAASGASRVLKAQHVRATTYPMRIPQAFTDMEQVSSVPLKGAGFDGRTMVVTNSASTRFDEGYGQNRPRLDVAIMGGGYLPFKRLWGRTTLGQATLSR